MGDNREPNRRWKAAMTGSSLVESSYANQLPEPVERLPAHIAHAFPVQKTGHEVKTLLHH